MKTIGHLGGMSWESTQDYYRLVNEEVRSHLGGLHSAKVVMLSVDFHEVEALMRAEEWDRVGDFLVERAKRVEAAGADFLLLCTNTMHKLADRIESSLSIPLLHIADAVAQSVKERGMRKIALLGTRFTMEQDFYSGRLKEKFGLEVIIPEAADRDLVDRVIFDELCRGIVRQESREAYMVIIDKLHAEGAEGLIEGCTEIPMLIDQEHSTLPIFDTTAIHAEAAVRWSLEL
jgi:aspartate racemase